MCAAPMIVKITWRNYDEAIDETLVHSDGSLKSQDAITAHVIRMIKGVGMQPGDIIAITKVSP